MKSRVRQRSDKQIAQVPAALAGACASVLQDHLTRLRKIGDHPNRICHFDQLLSAHLLGFYDPVVRSLRTLDAQTVASQTMKRGLDDLRLARSTICDAMGQLPADALLPLLQQLLGQLPEQCRGNLPPELVDLLTLKKRIYAIDGSYFRIPADVLWALAHRRANGKIGRQVRLDLHLDVLRFVPVKVQVDGHQRGSESAAFIATLEPGVIYLADRNFIDFDFLRAVVGRQSDFVVRLKNGASAAKLQVRAQGELSDKDRQAGVLDDQQVTLPGSRWAPGLGDAPLRVVTLWDPVKREQVRLLTTLADVPACLIGLLYRYRWAIELFFRWLKCVARIKHLFSESENGITMQFYIVIIATLLMYLHTGQRPGVTALMLMGLAAAGDLRIDKMPQVLDRIARERELERLRRQNKKKA